jgi:hypothetical protein
MHHLSLIAAAAAVVVAVPASAQLSVETDEAAFLAGLLDVETFDFDGLPDADFTNDVNAGLSVTITPGLSVSGTGFSAFGGDVGIVGEALELFIDPSSISSFTLTFNRPVDAFGADFIDAFDTTGVGVTINGETIDTSALVPIATTTAFFGFSSDTSFDEVTFELPVTQGFEFFSVDNLVTGVIPEPASLGLLSVGGLALLRRRR